MCQSVPVEALDTIMTTEPVCSWPLPDDDMGMVDVPPPGCTFRPDLVSRFESLGDNCEFGFVQRFHGAEPSALLRWATAPIEGVILGLADGWADLYAYKNLKPWASDMAWDDRYRAAFHGNILCDDSGFAQTEDVRRAAWAVDRDKLHYLRAKTLSGLKEASRI